MQVRGGITPGRKALRPAGAGPRSTQGAPIAWLRPPAVFSAPPKTTGPRAIGTGPSTARKDQDTGRDDPLNLPGHPPMPADLAMNRCPKNPEPRSRGGTAEVSRLRVRCRYVSEPIQLQESSEVRELSKLAGREDGALSLDGARTLDRTPPHRLAQNVRSATSAELVWRSPPSAFSTEQPACHLHDVS